MEKIVNIILKIISLPVAFYEVGDKSFYELLKETKYFEYFDNIFEDSIANVLLNNPAYIEKWLEWSEDKRSSDGWYFVINNNEKFEVGRINEDGKKGQYLEFSDKRNACAAFIKREIDELREY